MSFLQLKGKKFLVTGLANRRSVAWQTAKLLMDEGAQVIFTVHNEKRRQSCSKLLGDIPCFIYDAELDDDAQRLAKELQTEGEEFDGILHSIAFANYSEGIQPFHRTKRRDFMQAIQISAFSLVELSHALKPLLSPHASIVTIGISSLTVTPENYGAMGPVKAALRSEIRFLAKSFSADTKIRFNSVGSGPLKTNSSAGIPGYMDNYLYAEKLTFRKEAVTTSEVAQTAAFLLSPASSGINGEEIVVDAGMGMNAFDREIVEATMRSKS